MLLNNGAEPNIEDKYGNTPLHWASFRGQKFAAEILLDFGADGENINKSKQTALHFGKF